METSQHKPKLGTISFYGVISSVIIGVGLIAVQMIPFAGTIIGCILCPFSFLPPILFFGSFICAIITLVSSDYPEEEKDKAKYALLILFILACLIIAMLIILAIISLFSFTTAMLSLLFLIYNRL